MSTTRRIRALLVAFAATLALAGESGAQTEAHAITFDEAIRIALSRNAALRIAKNSASLDGVAVKEQRLGLLPDLRLSTQSGQNYGRTFSQSDGRILDQTTQSMSAGLSSSVTLFDGLRNFASLKQAVLSEKAGESDLRRAEQTVVFTVASNFVSLVKQQEQLRVQRENLASQEAQEKQIKIRVDAGTRPISDLYQLQATVAAARVEVVNAERAVELAKVDLIQTLQLDPSGAYDFARPALDTTASDTSSLAASDLAGLLKRALATRSDIDASESLVAAAEQGERSAKAGRWPTVSLTAGYNTAFSSATDLGFTDQLNQRRGGALAIGVSIPLFDRGSTDVAAQRAQVGTDNARIALENRKQQVGLEVRRVFLDFQSARRQLEATEALRRASALALDASTRRYEAGAATLLEVTQARATLVQAESALIGARYDLLLQRTLIGYYTGDLDPKRATIG